MPGLVVVNGAQLLCDKCPGALSGLVVTGGLGTPQIAGQEVATTADHVAGENIEPFPGECKTTHKPCDPQTPIPWLLGESSTLLPSFVPLLSETSVLLCTRGAGVIQIVGAGQSTIIVNSAGCEPPPEQGLFERLLDDVTMTDVANAPTPDSCIIESRSPLEQALVFGLAVGAVVRGGPTAVQAAGGATAVRAAAVRAADFLSRHINISPDGLPTPNDPRAAAALKAAKEVIKALTK